MSVRAAIVTGAASGIGRAIATDLAAQGARVLFADLNAEEGERVAADFSTGAFQLADTAKQSDGDALVARAVREFGGVDILVNNAGLQHVAPVMPPASSEHRKRTYAATSDGSSSRLSAAGASMMSRITAPSLIPWTFA